MSKMNRRTFLDRLLLGVAALTVSRVLPGGLASAQGTPQAAAWPTGMALDIDLTVATQATGRVKRPYVAVWIEDPQGNTVRNVSIWVRQGHGNPRWVDELRRWTRQNGELVSTVSSATRNPGRYTVAWDGKNDKGKLLAQGTYSVCVESAREHGPYSLVRQAVTVGATPFKKNLGSDNDIEGVSVSLVKA